MQERWTNNAGSPDWQALADLALTGLQTMYGAERELPHSARLNGPKPQMVGHNLRYALIALIGLARAKGLIADSGRLSTTLQDRVLVGLRRQHLGLGDLGLLLWARALNPEMAHGSRASITEMTRGMDPVRGTASCDSVELSWLSIGAEHAAETETDEGRGRDLGRLAMDSLVRLYQPRTSLFARHARPGLLPSVSRRVACFANQVYPLLALAQRASRGCEKSAVTAQSLVTKLLSLQGPRGQWWWLYDAETGAVVERYPVFSVHQDGMAPMALHENARALDWDLSQAVRRSVQWIHGQNEVGESLVVAWHGLILRDVHPRGAGRVTRMVKAAAWCGGWRARGNGHHRCYVINRECRPYHLGWVLYAAGLATRGQTPKPARTLEGAVA